MTEQELEQQIKDKGLNAPRLTPELIDKVIVGKTFTTLPSGKSMICEITLKNGFTVRGESSCVSKENFDMDIGRIVAYKHAYEKIWPLEAYLLQQSLYESQ